LVRKDKNEPKRNDPLKNKRYFLKLLHLVYVFNECPFEIKLNFKLFEMKCLKIKIFKWKKRNFQNEVLFEV